MDNHHSLPTVSVPADLWRDELSSLIAGAYADGCTDTHAAWEAGVAGSADDFGEAASDYAFDKREAIDSLLARIEKEVGHG